MERRKVIAMCSASLTTASILVILSLMAQPEVLEVEPGDVEHVEVGTLIVVEGLVGPDGVRDLGTASAFRVVGDDGGSAQVFAGFRMRDLHPGDRVRLTGTVALYKGAREIVVGSAADIELVARDPRPRVALEDLLSDPWAYAGVEPRVEVVVASPPVATAGGNCSWCMVAAGPAGPTAAMLVPREVELDRWTVGARLEVACLVRYDAARGVVWLEPTGWRAV